MGNRKRRITKAHKKGMAILATGLIIGMAAGALLRGCLCDKAEAVAVEAAAVQQAVELPEITVTYLDQKDVELIGRTIWGEAGGVQSEAERAAVAWCILNRVDAWGKSIEEVVTAPNQFYGYRQNGECPQEHLDLAEDVLLRWADEKAGAENVGRTLPEGYLYFIGDGERNHFSKDWKSTAYWDWTLFDPYTEN